MMTTKEKYAGSVSKSTTGSGGAIIAPSLVTSFTNHRRSLKEDQDEETLNSSQQGDEGGSSSAASSSISSSVSSSSSGYVPAFEGYLTIKFSVYIPGLELSGDENISQSADDALESLVMLFLCSKEVQLVISEDPTMPLVPVCPFNELNAQHTHTHVTIAETTMDDSSGTTQINPNAALVNNNKNYYDDSIIVWNLLKTTTRTVPFDTNITTTTGTADTISNEEQQQQYYTQWEFTYPVYQWGTTNIDGTSGGDDDKFSSKSNSNSNGNGNGNGYHVQNEILQDSFDTQLIDPGTLDSLLPWSNAIASSYGNEPYLFWDETLPPTTIQFDTEIPMNVVHTLMSIGGGMMVLNTIFILVMNFIAVGLRRRRLQYLQKCEERKLHYANRSNYSNSNINNNCMTMEEGIRSKTHGYEYLDTEEGVSAILMESKQYAITKSHRSTKTTISKNNMIATPKEENLVKLAKKQSNRISNTQYEGGGGSSGSGGHHAWYSNTVDYNTNSDHNNNNLLGSGSEDDVAEDNLILSLSRSYDSNDIRNNDVGEEVQITDC